MSGHNKWTQIKRQKEKTDGAKSKIFSKFAKLLTEEARKAKGNRTATGLATAIERARAVNMPSDNIERAIKKATDLSTGTMESITYEAYGPGGVALIIEALTGNRNKAAQEIKHILSEHGGNLASMGAASWAFSKDAGVWNAHTTVPLSPEDIISLEKLVDALEDNDEVNAVYTNAE